MPHRIMNLWTVVLGIAALVIVALMVLFGADLVRASRTGPRWKRSMVTAALSLMAVLGIAAPRGLSGGPARTVRSLAGRGTSPVLAVFDLEAQLKELTKLTSSRHFDGVAARGTLRSVNANVAILAKPANIAKLTHKGQARAKFLIAAASKQTALARALIPIGTTNLARSAQWKTVTDAWSYSALVVRVKRKVLVERLGKTSGWQAVETTLKSASEMARAYGSTSAQRAAIVKQMDIAKARAQALASVGLLAAGEAELLTGELGRLRKDIFSIAPTDLRVSCYETPAADPIGDSTKRLTKRIPTLSKLVESGRLNPLIARKLLPSLRADIKTLTNAKKAAALRKQAAQLLARIDRKLTAYGGR